MNHPILLPLLFAQALFGMMLIVASSCGGTQPAALQPAAAPADAETAADAPGENGATAAGTPTSPSAAWFGLAGPQDCWTAHSNPPDAPRPVPHVVLGPFLGAPSPLPPGVAPLGPTPAAIVVERAGDTRLPSGYKRCIDPLDFSRERAALIWFLGRNARVVSVNDQEAAIDVALFVEHYCGGVAPSMMGPIVIGLPASEKPVRVRDVGDRGCPNAGPVP
jgi:hypothetical protein